MILLLAAGVGMGGSPGGGAAGGGATAPQLPTMGTGR